jgi:hypothetical protein
MARSESMFGMKRNLAKCVMILALLLPTLAQAMTIVEFERMQAKDRQDYLDFLVEGAQKVLIDEGQKEVAAKVYQLFHEIHPGDALSFGEIAFEENLARARVADAKRHANEPNARRLEVEDALFVTLKKNGIQLPKAFFTIGSNFKPKYPPQHK